MDSQSGMQYGFLEYVCLSCLCGPVLASHKAMAFVPTLNPFAKGCLVCNYYE